MPHYYIWTIGCQMNKAESERLGSLFEFPVSVLNPFDELGGAARARVEGGPQFTQAVGLALRNA